MPARGRANSKEQPGCLSHATGAAMEATPEMLTRVVSVLAWLTILYAVAMGVITGAERKPKAVAFTFFPHRIAGAG